MIRSCQVGVGVGGGIDGGDVAVAVAVDMQ